jgi:type IV pilus assembly protein PilM
MKLLNFLKNLLPKPPALLGLTLDQQGLQLVELSRVGDDYLLRYCNQIPCPSNDATQNFSFAHPAFPDFLKQTIQTTNITTNQVALALPYSSVLFKSIELDKQLNESEIAIQVHAHAEQYFNYPLSELMIDFELLDTSKNHPDLIELRWVAARKLEVETQINALAVAGLQVVAVEVDSFSLQRVASYYLKKQSSQLDNVVVIQVYDSHILLMVLGEKKCIYTRIENYIPDTREDLNACIFSTVTFFLNNQTDKTPSLILLAGHRVSAELLERINAHFNITARYLDVFSLLNFFTPHPPHQFAISTGLAMRFIL